MCLRSSTGSVINDKQTMKMDANDSNIQFASVSDETLEKNYYLENTY